MSCKTLQNILKFKQSNWMRPYIDFDTQKRAITNNESQNFYFQINEQFSIWQNYGKFKKKNKNKNCKK